MVSRIQFSDNLPPINDINSKLEALSQSKGELQLNIIRDPHKGLAFAQTTLVKKGEQTCKASEIYDFFHETACAMKSNRPFVDHEQAEALLQRYKSLFIVQQSHPDYKRFQETSDLLTEVVAFSHPKRGELKKRTSLEALVGELASRVFGELLNKFNNDEKYSRIGRIGETLSFSEKVIQIAIKNTFNAVNSKQIPPVGAHSFLIEEFKTQFKSLDLRPINEPKAMEAAFKELCETLLISESFKERLSEFLQKASLLQKSSPTSQESLPLKQEHQSTFQKLEGRSAITVDQLCLAFIKEINRGQSINKSNPQRLIKDPLSKEFVQKFAIELQKAENTFTKIQPGLKRKNLFRFAEQLIRALNTLGDHKKFAPIKDDLQRVLDQIPFRKILISYLAQKNGISSNPFEGPLEDRKSFTQAFEEGLAIITTSHNIDKLSKQFNNILDQNKLHLAVGNSPLSVKDIIDNLEKTGGAKQVMLF